MLVRLTLVQQNDIHAMLADHVEVAWSEGGWVAYGAGGFARASALAKRLGERSDASLLVDGGDAIHGTFEAAASRGRGILPILDAGGVDLMVVGNWEFAYGPEALRNAAREASFPVLGANVLDAADGRGVLQADHVEEVAGVRIGFLGVTTPIVAQTMPPRFSEGLRFADPIETLRSGVARLREEEGCDLVVVLSHVGLAQDVEMMRRVEGVDVVLSAHTHERLLAPLRVGGSWIIQSGFSGSFLGALHLDVEAGRLREVRHELVGVPADGEEDDAVASRVEAFASPHRKALEEPVGTTREVLHRMGALQSPMDDLLTDAYRALTGADVAFSHGWRYGSPIAAGTITLGDLWRIVPTDPEVHTVSMTGREILEALEQSLHDSFGPPLGQKGGYPARTSGMRVLARLNNPRGARVLDARVGAERLDPSRTYLVAGAGDQSAARGERTGTGTRAVDAMKELLARGPWRDPGAPRLVAA